MAVKILAADDSTTMRKVLEMTFAGEAVEIETVGSGEAAVERASKTSPDLVIADASMTMDGYEVARALKSSPATQSVAVIVLASQHHPYDAERGRAAGVDDHVLKPYDSQAMLEKAKEVLSRPRSRATAAAQPVAAAPARPAATPPSPPSPPSPPRLPTAPAARAPSAAPGVGRPGTSPPSPRSTVSFGAVQPPKPSAPGARPVLELAEEEPAARAPTPAPAQPKPIERAPAPSARPAATATPSPAVAAATAPNGDMAARLAGLGLSREQVEGVLGLSREIIERVVWEVVPDLAETIIREEIKRLTAD